MNPQPRIKINMNDSKLLGYNWRPALVLHSDSFIKGKSLSYWFTHTHTLILPGGTDWDESSPLSRLIIWPDSVSLTASSTTQRRQRDRLRRGGSVFLLLRGWNQAQAGHYVTAGGDLTEIIKHHRRCNYINSHSVPKYEKITNVLIESLLN